VTTHTEFRALIGPLQLNLLMQAALPVVGSLVLPKVHTAQDLHHISRAVMTASRITHRHFPLQFITSIESARGMWNLGTIAGWKSEYGPELGGRLSALLVGALHDTLLPF
jgi:citrate lyase subunit beta-like protein